MKNITVTIPDDVYRQARVWAAKRDTSVSAVVTYLLETLPGVPRAEQRFGRPGPPQPGAQVRSQKMKEMLAALLETPANLCRPAQPQENKSVPASAPAETVTSKPQGTVAG